MGTLQPSRPASTKTLEQMYTCSIEARTSWQVSIMTSPTRFWHCQSGFGSCSTCCLNYDTKLKGKHLLAFTHVLKHAEGPLDQILHRHVLSIGPLGALWGCCVCSAIVCRVYRLSDQHAIIFVVCTYMYL